MEKWKKKLNVYDERKHSFHAISSWLLVYGTKKQIMGVAKKKFKNSQFLFKLFCYNGFSMFNLIFMLNHCQNIPRGSFFSIKFKLTLIAKPESFS